MQTPYAPPAEARQIVAHVRQRVWLEGYQQNNVAALGDQLTRAVQLAPAYAAAHAGLARVHAAMYSVGIDATPARRELARQALEHAEALDAAAADVRLSRAWYSQMIEGNAAEAMRLVNAVLEVCPDDGPSLLLAGRLALASGRWRTAVDVCQRATRGKPPSSLPYQSVAYVANFLRDYAAAATWAQEAVRLDAGPLYRRLTAIWYSWLADPDPVRAVTAIRLLPEAERRTREVAWCECQFLLARRRFAEALAIFAAAGANVFGSTQAIDETAYLLRLQRWADAPARDATERQLQEMLDPARAISVRSATRLMQLAYGWAVLGDAERAQHFCSEALAVRPWPVHAVDGARVAGANEFYFSPGQLTLLAILGETDRFFVVLEKWINVPAAVDVRYLAFDPTFDRLRSDPRWRTIIHTAQMPIAVSDPPEP